MAKRQKKTRELKVGRQITNVKGMAYAPTTELGVVFLFGRLAPSLGFCVENIHPRFPDCLATRNGSLCRIEFELWASDFESHEHPPQGADVIVCWENDWESRPPKYQHIEIIDLKKYVGATPRVFVVGCAKNSTNSDELNARWISWSVPINAQIDHLVLMYRAAKGIRDVWKIVGSFQKYGKHNKLGYWPGLQAGMRLVARLEQPLTYDILKRDPRTSNLGVVRVKFQGKRDITDDWPLVYDKIVCLNPNTKAVLRKYHFD